MRRSAGEHWRVPPVDVDDDAPAVSHHEREARVLALRLRELVDREVHKPGDVAVLVRRGRAAVPIARALARVGLPSLVVGGDGFWARPEVTDVVAALTLAADPTDEIAMLTVLRSPLVALVDDQIVALYEKLPKRRGLTWERALALVNTPAWNSADEANEATRDRLLAFDVVLARVKRRLHEPTFDRTGLLRAVDVILDDGRYAAACAVESDGAARLRNLEKLRAMVENTRESSLVALARLGAAVDEQPPEPLATLLEAEEAHAVRIMTIHQAKGLEFPVVILADAGSGLRSETDDVAFDADVGLAVTARGRPIAACVQKSSKTGALTAIQRVRRRIRERNECELARLLYVALTRARDKIYVVGAPRRQGAGSLLGILESVRAVDAAAFDALLPRVVVGGLPVVDEAGAADGAAALGADGAVAAGAPDARRRGAPYGGVDESALAPLPVLPPVPSQRRRVRASEIARASGVTVSESASAGRASEGRDPVSRLGIEAVSERVEGVDESERLPPRAAGRLAHAIIALVAQEARAVVQSGDARKLSAVVNKAARACGVDDAPGDFVERCAATLAGPMRALVDAGYALSFEESVWLETDRIVVEGRVDLVARRPGHTLVVELKLSEKSAWARSAWVQVSAYAAALAQRGEPGVEVVTWTLGESAARAAAPFDESMAAKLAEHLVALV